MGMVVVSGPVLSCDSGWMWMDTFVFNILGDGLKYAAFCAPLPTFAVARTRFTQTGPGAVQGGLSPLWGWGGNDVLVECFGSKRGAP